MTAFKCLALCGLICGLLVSSAAAEPLTTTSGDWWWWSPPYTTQSTDTWSPQQFANVFNTPVTSTSTTGSLVSPVFSSTYTPTTSDAVLAPTSSSSTTATTPAPLVANANLNLGTGPFPLDSTITTGNSQPWYTSSQISSFFGGQPTAQQISSFDNTVFQRVEQTFQQSGVPVNLTLNSTGPAAHTLSLVSGSTSNTTPGVIGMTQLGGSGFSFIDQEAKAAQSLDQLEWIVAHNISHELMLAFGVGENYDTTGNYIDARNANWSMMTNPDSTFSSAAAQALQTALATNSSSSSTVQGAQLINGQPVPEPTTVACWLVGLSAAVLVRRSATPRSEPVRPPRIAGPRQTFPHPSSPC